jgi:hypothetical protein
MAHLNSKNAAAPLDYASIARIASAVELQEISLRASRAILRVPTSGIEDDLSGKAFVGFETTVVPHKSDGRAFAINAAFIAVYRSDWEGAIPNELPEPDPDNPPEIEIEARFELSYVAEDDSDLDPQDLSNFAAANGTLHAWPYWREFADDITRRMQLPRLVVGVFKFPSRHDPGGRSEAESADGERTDPSDGPEDAANAEAPEQGGASD